MLTLGIETTCDETACAIVKGQTILSNIIASQADLHNHFGGVVPELACRHHAEQILPVLDKALKSANVSLNQIELIGVAQGPGLIGALLIGLSFAKALALALNKPFIGVNHLEAHLYAAIMSSAQPVAFPALGVVISGGHTALVHIDALGHYRLISQTADDAIGEAFDKVAALLNLPYPGGPAIEALAKEGNPHAFPFKAGKIKTHPLAFSFSGLKTQVLYTLRNLSASDKIISLQTKRDIAASFQRAALTDIATKTLAASQTAPYQTILLGGGVSNNQSLRQLFATTLPHLPTLWPAPTLCLDNAAMIAGLAAHNYTLSPTPSPLSLKPLTRILF